MIFDPMGFVEKINAGACEGKIEIGCGPTRHRHDYITVDLLEHESVDVTADIYEFLDSLKSGSVTAIYASHFIEHVTDLNSLMKKIARVCRSGAVIEFVAPHFSNPFFYSDYTHKSFFGLYSFCYLAEDRSGLTRQVPKYGVEPDFEQSEVSLHFKSYRPNYIRHAFKRTIEKIVNVGPWSKEAYEELFAWIIPCYEVRYVLKRRENSTTAPSTQGK